MIPLVLVHGFMGGSAQWDNLRGYLEGPHDLITLDLPGFGANNHMPPIDTIEGYADWVIGALNRAGVERYHLLGHSMGGMIVQEVVRKDRARIERLVLYATGAVGVIPGRFETIEESKRRASTDGAEATARRIAATWFLEETEASNYAACAEIAAQATLPAILAGLDAMQAWSGEAHLGSLTPETLLVWGDCDRTYSWAQTDLLWRNIPNVNLAVIPGCAHAVHLEKEAIFSALLRDHLSR